MRSYSITLPRCRQLIVGCFVFVCGLSQTTHADTSVTGGLGVAVQSNGAYSPLVDVSLSGEKWKFDANVSGYSESTTRVTHLLAGVLYVVPLIPGKVLALEAGLGTLLAQTSVKSERDRMYSLAVPLGINWTIFRRSAFVFEANWKSWIFSQPTYLPPLAILSHDRFTTLTLAAGVAL